MQWYPATFGDAVPGPQFGRASHEIKLCRLVSGRYFVNCIAERSGSVANRNRPCLLTSEPSRSMRRSRWRGHMRRSSGQTTGCLARSLSTGIVNRSKAIGRAEIQYKGRIAKLEAAASSCNGGCQTSFKTGNAPWVGCSFAGGEVAGVGPYSLTCTDTLNYKTYSDSTTHQNLFGLGAKRGPVALHQPARRGQAHPRKGRPKSSNQWPLVHARPLAAVRDVG